MTNDPTDDPIIREWFSEDYLAREKAQHLTEVQRHKLIGAVRDIFATRQGKLFLCWLLAETHMYKPSFTGNSMTYFLEGERSVGLKTFSLLVEAEPNVMQELVNFKRSEGIENE